jgi:hypothetical protein
VTTSRKLTGKIKPTFLCIAIKHLVVLFPGPSYSGGETLRQGSKKLMDSRLGKSGHDSGLSGSTFSFRTCGSSFFSACVCVCVCLHVCVHVCVCVCVSVRERSNGHFCHKPELHEGKNNVLYSVFQYLTCMYWMGG